MKNSNFVRILTGTIACLAIAAHSVQGALVLSGASYTQDFNALGSGLPADWSVRTAANGTSLGTPVASFSTAAADWSNTTGAFKNFASATGLASTDVSATQAASPDRALGIRQTAAVGDAGAAFTLEIANTTGFSSFSLSLDLDMLSVQPRSTTWSIQYGIGAVPLSFSTVYTYTDPGVFGTTPTGAISFGSALDNLTDTVWIRVVALTSTTGSGSRDSFGIDDFNLTWSGAAPDLYFDTNGAAAGIGGTGIWDTTTTNWNPLADGTGAPAVFSSTNKVVFGGTAGTVTIDAGGVSAAAGIQFDVDGYTLTGGPLTLASPTVNTTHTTGTTTIASVIAGTAGLQKIGPGVLSLTGANTFIGAVSINAGTLRISTDGNLGTTTNAITLGGGKLNPTASITLDAARTLGGSGTLEIPGGSTLTVPGTASLTTLTLDGGGNLDFTGAAPSIGNLIVSGASTISSLNPITTTAITTTNTAGTATISAPLTLGTGTRIITVADGAAATDLALSGSVTSTGVLHKLGDGALELSGFNTLTTVRLGTTAAVPANGGTLIIHDTDDLGSGPFQFNAGTLDVRNGGTPLSLTNTLSLGGGQLPGGATFTGDDVSFGGTAAIFKATGTTVQHKITANSDVTFAGGLNASSGSGVSSGLSILGTGTVILNAATNTITETITVDGGNLEISGALTGATIPAITTTNLGILSGISTGATGAGSVTAATDGIIAPGTPFDSTGTLITLDANISLGALDVDLAGTGPGLFDQLSVTGAVTLGGTLMASLTGGYVPVNGDLITIIANDDTDAVSGTFIGLNEGDPVGTTGFFINYAGGDGNDVVLTTVPEPGSTALLLGGLALLGMRGRRRKSSI